jgi:drug/metabolite transporter (DMT)-like permease
MKKPAVANYALLGCVGIVWGTQFLLNELALESFPPLMIAAGRLVIGFFTLGAACRIMPRSNSSPRESARQPWGLYFAIAVFEGILPSCLVTWGFQRVFSSIAAILMATIPIFTLLLTTYVVRNETWKPITAVSIALGFAGVLILVGPCGQKNWMVSVNGELSILGGAIAFAISLILMRRLPALSPVLMMRNIFLLAAVPMVVLACAMNQPWERRITWSSMVGLLGLGIFCGAAVYVMLAALTLRAGATFASLSNYVVVLVGVSVGIVFRNEKFTVLQVIALFLILMALALSQGSDLSKTQTCEVFEIKR